MPKNFSCKYFISSAGFTLVELLVVMAIISIVTIISFPSFSTFSRQQILQSEAEKMASRIKLAQSNARSGNQGEDETEEVQGFMIDFINVDSTNKYYLKKHRNDLTNPYSYVVTEDEYTLDQSITNITFEVGGTEVTTKVFYFQSSRGYLSCLTAVPVNGNDQAECVVSQFKITLLNSQGEAKYVYIERGGAV